MPNADTERLIAMVEARTGYAVSVGTTDSSAADAEMVAAGPSHPVHVINISTRCIRIADYITASQCVMLLTMWMPHPARVIRFELRPQTVDRAVQAAAAWSGLARFPRATVLDAAKMMVMGLLRQLRSTPSELLAIEYCHQECPLLREQQREAVRASLRRNAESLKPDVKALSPPDLYEKNQILCAVLACFWSELSGDTAAVLPYQAIGVYENAISLLDVYRRTTGTMGERSTATVDRWADTLGLRSLYQWTMEAC